MKKRFMPTIIAVVILIALGLYANYFETEEILPQGVEKPVELLKATRENVSSITWNKNGKELVEVSKNEKGDFSITKPLPCFVEASELDGVFNHLKDLKSELVIAENATQTSDYGIGTNSSKLIVKIADKTEELIIGNDVPVGGSIYLAKTGDSRIFMVPTFLKSSLVKKFDDLRSRNLFHEEFNNISEISIKQKGKDEILLKKAEALEWNIVKPVSLSGDIAEITTLISGMRNLRIAAFIKDNPGEKDDFGFATPEYEFVLKNKDGKEYKLVCGEISGQDIYVSNGIDKSVYAVKKSDIQSIAKDINTLRGKALGSLAIKDITEIKLHNSSGTHHLKKVDSKWVENGNSSNSKNVDSFLETYEAALISDFLPAEKRKENLLSEAELKTAPFAELIAGDKTDKIFLGEVEGINLSVWAGEELKVTGLAFRDAFEKLNSQLNSKEKVVIKDNNATSAAEISTSKEVSVEEPKKENP